MVQQVQGRQTYPKHKIYTGTGDKGKTSLVNGRKISKDHFLIEIYGEIDELNSAIGVAITHVSSVKHQGLSIKNELIEIQRDLFKITPLLDCLIAKQGTKYFKARINEFERKINELDKKLPKIKSFILPGGGKTGSFLHLARAVCRRAERRLVQLTKKHKVDASLLVYFNRLSDLLFTMARFVNYQEGEKEICP